MSRKANTLGQAWFYHAPSKKSNANADPIGYPPLSQIPGLSNLSHLPPEEPKTYWIRDTDSNYVRLAKQGGRQDLLSMQPTRPQPDGPVGYPRCEWFYDNIPSKTVNQDQSEEPHQFMLPDYMVHQPLTKKTVDANDCKFSPEKLPYAFDQKTAYEREGGRPSDKTVRIQEDKKFGYGVRSDTKKDSCKKKSTKSGNPHYRLGAH